jgi:hypothetical protein
MRELLDAGNREQDNRRGELTEQRDAALIAKECLASSVPLRDR